MNKKKLIFTVFLLLECGGLALAQVCGEEAWLIPGMWSWCLTAAVLAMFLEGVLNVFVGILKWAILLNPDPAAVNPLIAAYIGVLQPLFVFCLTVIGFYLIFMSGSPGGRARAKSLFLKMIMTMILMTLSPQIFRIMLDLSQALTLKALSSVTANSLNIDYLESTIAYLLISFFVIPVMLFAGISIGLRWILVLILAAVFPLTIFFYIFDMPLIGQMGKEIGMKLWKLTLGVIFSQVAQGLMFSITVIAFGSLTESTGFGKLAGAVVGIAGFIGIAIAPLLVMGLLGWIGGALMTGGMMVSFVHPGIGFAMTAAGGLMMGQGPAGSMMAAGGVAAMTKASQTGQRDSSWATASQQSKES